jgi:exonuclease SbcD
VVLAGNHDAEGLLRVVAEALGDPGPAGFDPDAPCATRVRVLPKPCPPRAGAVATYAVAGGPDIRLGCLPFVHANRLLREFGELAQANATYADKVNAITAEIGRHVVEGFDHRTQVAVFASHLHVEGARLSSERQLHVSSAYAADPSHLHQAYGYLAFGHIHRPQDLPGGRGRYAGSLLEVDFGEEAEEKVVVVADLEPNTYPTITTVPLRSGRRLRRARGTLAALAARAGELGDAIVEVTVDHDPADDAALELASAGTSLAARVREALPAATVVGVVDARRPGAATLDEAGPAEAEPTLADALRAYLAGDGAGPLADAQADAGRVAALFDELLHAAELGLPATTADDDRLAELLERREPEAEGAA